MEKQKRAKTDIEKRAVLLDILYELANEATKYLRNILLKPYKEISSLSKGLRYCFNCDNLLQAYCYGPSVISVTVTTGGYLRGGGLYKTSRTIGRGVAELYG